jgi:aspartyl protease family protein
MAACGIAISRGFGADVVISAGPLIECGVMRTIMILAAFMIGLGTIMAQVADRMTPAQANTAPRKTVAMVDGQRIGFMVDTGASVIALNESSAARFGLRPSRDDYRMLVTTANGTVRAAATRLAVVDIGGIVVHDVDAMVLPDEALSENLLGLSFLSRLKRFEYASGKMVLEQ